jgi:tRNA dimethylallyltransferase
LHVKIAERFDAMLSAGLVEELALLRSRYALHRHLPSMRSVGYRQAWSYLEGEIDRNALRAQGIAATRQLAKRQFTWLQTVSATQLPTAPEEAITRIAAAAQ